MPEMKVFIIYSQIDRYRNTERKGNRVREGKKKCQIEKIASEMLAYSEVIYKKK